MAAPNNVKAAGVRGKKKHGPKSVIAQLEEYVMRSLYAEKIEKTFFPKNKYILFFYAFTEQDIVNYGTMHI